MKKKIITLLAISYSLIFLVGKVAFATDNGNLQLDPNVITKSNGGVGTTSDFPIRNELFTPALNQVVKEQMQDKVPEQQKALNFSKQTTNTLYDTNTAQITKKLFVNYKPQIITSNTDNISTQTTLWYWLFSIIAIDVKADYINNSANS